MADTYADIYQIQRDNAEILRPPRRLTVPEAAERYVYLDTPGGYAGPWKNDLPHYMVKPAECLTSRDYEAVVFSGPAQTAKTAMLVDNWMAHTITCDPADFMVVQTAQDTARDYSKRRVDRMIAASDYIREKLRKGGSSDNTFDKYFRSGMILSLGWPTKNQLAGKAIGKMALTDYDRMPDDVDGEGAAFYLAKKRTTTFLSRGMTMAEGSPSKPILDPKWEPKTPHEAPPTKGILGLYNTGDRHRLYGKCDHCGDYYMPKPGMEAMYVPEIAHKEPDYENIGLICTNCGGVNTDERAFKRSVVWLKEGQTISKDGVIHGEGRKSKIASFLMIGWAAAFQSWQSIVRNYYHAKDIYDRTGDEEALKNTTNLDQGAPYLDKTLSNTRSQSEIESRAEPVEKRVVPDKVRFLLASIDVQKGRFVCQVEGFCEHLESHIIDRFNLKLSHRDDENGNVQPLEPGSYLEDWDVIIDNVLEKTYPIQGTDKRMPILKVACDSGGQEGVTEKAYNFWRKLQNLGYSHKNPSKSRFILVKGGSTMNAPDVRETFPGANGRERKAKARGEIPVYLINTNTMKDNLANNLDRKEPGPNYTHFPQWLGGFFFAELTAEIRTPKGWLNPSNKRNEAFDLMVYVRVLLKLIGADKINWNNPPLWAKTIIENPVLSDGFNIQQQVQQRTRRVRSRGVQL